MHLLSHIISNRINKRVRRRRLGLTSIHGELAENPVKIIRIAAYEAIMTRKEMKMILCGMQLTSRMTELGSRLQVITFIKDKMAAHLRNIKR